MTANTKKTPKMFRIVPIILCFLTLFCKSQSVFAQTFFGAGTEALGDSGRAANVALDAHFLNPAALAFSKDSNFGIAYQTLDQTTGSPSSNYAFVLTDNDPEKIMSGGLAYVYKRSSFPDHTIIDQDMSIDLAMKIVPTISLGVQTHRLFRMNNIAPGFSKYNVSTGLMVLPKHWLGMALVFYDMLNDDDQDMIPVTAIATHIIIMDIMRIRADVTHPEKRNPTNGGTLNLGLELDGGSGFLFRVGGQWDTVNQKTFWAAGIGWEGPRLSVAYAFRNNISVVGDTIQTFQAWLNF